MNRLLPIIIAFIGALIALIITVELSTSQASFNLVAVYVGIAAFVIPLLSPLRGYIVLIFLGAYLEIFKFFAWAQNASQVDMLALNIPPICAVAGISASALILMATGRIRATFYHLLVWVGTIGIGCVVGLKVLLAGAEAGGEAASLGDAANAAAYLMLIPTTATLLRSPEDWRKLLSVAIWMMVPVALYGIYQGIVGYPDLHLQFVSSYRGWGVDSTGYIQPVGTLNGALAFGTAVGICFCAVCMRANMLQRFRSFDVVLLLIFLAAAVISGRRSSLLLILAFGVGLVFFKTPRRAFVFYTASLAGVASLYLLANPLIYLFDTMNRVGGERFEENTFMARMANVGTFNDRLIGFRNMTTNPDLRSLFGADLGDDYGKFGFGLGDEASIQKRAGNYELLRDDFVHDGLNKALISYGFVPVGILAIIGFVVVFRIHRLQFWIADPVVKGQLRYGISFLFAAAFLLLTSQQALTVQPVNLLVFMVFGAFLYMARQAYNSQRSQPAWSRTGKPVVTHQGSQPLPAQG